MLGVASLCGSFKPENQSQGQARADAQNGACKVKEYAFFTTEEAGAPPPPPLVPVGIFQKGGGRTEC